jgi:hypothetical protein
MAKERTGSQRAKRAGAEWYLLPDTVLQRPTARSAAGERSHSRPHNRRGGAIDGGEGVWPHWLMVSA